MIHLPCISNYTDFEALEDEPDVAVHYLSDPGMAPRLDVLIIPGTKGTVADLKWLRRAGWEDFLVRHRRGGGWIVGICGGYQMLGRRIVDAVGVESDTPETVGLGLLEIETTFQSEKITDRIRAIHLRDEPADFRLRDSLRTHHRHSGIPRAVQIDSSRHQRRE